MIVRSIMSSRVLTIEAHESTCDAAQRMKNGSAGSLVVVDNGRAVGIVTERDLVERVICGSRDAKAVSVREIMNSPLITGSPDWTVEEAAKLMSAKRIKRLPIVENGALVGILSVTDIVLNVHKLHGEIVKVWQESRWK